MSRRRIAGSICPTHCASCASTCSDGQACARQKSTPWTVPSLDGAAPALDSQALIDHLTLAGLQASLEAVLGRQPLPLAEQAGPGDMPAEVEARWWHYFGLLNFERLEQEMRASLRQWVERNDEPSHRRLRALSEACAALRGGEQADEDG